MVGKAKMYNASFRNEYVRLHDINGGGQLHMTPTEMLLTTLTGTLPGGGSAAGKLRIENWLGEVPAQNVGDVTDGEGCGDDCEYECKDDRREGSVDGKAVKVPVVQPAHAYLEATVDRIPLRTIMDVTAPKNYGDLGFDTAMSGPVQVEWGGAIKIIADTMQVEATLKFAPMG